MPTGHRSHDLSPLFRTTVVRWERRAGLHAGLWQAPWRIAICRMAQLIRFWFELCLLRAAPQDMSASPLVLGMSVCSYALVSVLLATLSNGFHDGVRMALLELSLLAIYVAGVLYLLSRPARIRQTLAALTGSGTLLGLPALLMIMLTGAQPTAPLLSAGWLLLMLWNLLVNAHIMRHALSSSLAVGFALSLLYALLYLQVVRWLIPM